jgi:hypothetical protein
MSLQRRLAKLEQAREGDGGTGIVGVRRAHHLTREGPDAVAVTAIGETLTEAEFDRRYPRGTIVCRLEYGEQLGRDGEGR